MVPLSFSDADVEGDVGLVVVVFPSAFFVSVLTIPSTLRPGTSEIGELHYLYLNQILRQFPLY